MAEPSAIQAMVIDDDQAIRVLVSKVLSSKGMQVHAFSEPLAALQWAEEGRADCAFIDVQMPRLDGFELARALREKWPELSILFISGGVDVDESLRRSKEIPKALFMQKPFSLDDLLAAVRWIVEARAAPGAPLPLAVHSL